MGLNGRSFPGTLRGSPPRHVQLDLLGAFAAGPFVGSMLKLSRYSLPLSWLISRHSIFTLKRPVEMSLPDIWRAVASDLRELPLRNKVGSRFKTVSKTSINFLKNNECLSVQSRLFTIFPPASSRWDASSCIRRLFLRFHPSKREARLRQEGCRT